MSLCQAISEVVSSAFSQLPEANSEAGDIISLTASRRNQHLQSGPPERERIHFCSLKSPSLWLVCYSSARCECTVLSLTAALSVTKQTSGQGGSESSRRLPQITLPSLPTRATAGPACRDLDHRVDGWREEGGPGGGLEGVGDETGR